MKTSDAMRKMIEGWEGLRLEAYPDPATGGDPWTIGYGHTGPDTAEGVVITQEQADALMAHDLARFEEGVAAELGDAPVTQGQFDAMVSLSYNIGLGNFRKSSVLRDHLAGNYQMAADAFLLWNKAAGREMDGLTRRREGEAQAYIDDSPGV